MNAWLRCRLVADRFVAAALLAVLSPVIAVLAMVVRRHDGGPAFVRVERMGQGFVPFAMWKLRTMRADAPGGRASGPSLTAQHDARITQVGAWLRAHHLDELPQLVNVARGQMLLLGPRPEAPDYVEHGDPRWQRLMTVPPGIAGPTQLIVSDWERRIIGDAPEGDAYRAIVLPVKLAIDLWYLDRASPRCDAQVAWALVRRFATPGRTTPLRRRIERDVASAREASLDTRSAAGAE